MQNSDILFVCVCHNFRKGMQFVVWKWNRDDLFDLGERLYWIENEENLIDWNDCASISIFGMNRKNHRWKIPDESRIIRTDEYESPGFYSFPASSRLGSWACHARNTRFRKVGSWRQDDRRTKCCEVAKGVQLYVLQSSLSQRDLWDHGLHRYETEAL